MRAITPADLPDDPLLMWAAQNGSRAWASGDGRAFAVAGAELSRRDRLAVAGPRDALVPLVREVLGEVGPSYRLFGARPTVAALVAEVSGLAAGGDFGWMDRVSARGDGAAPAGRGPARGGAGGSGGAGTACWLRADEEAEVADVLTAGFPTSYAVPGAPGVRRWAGIRDDDGRLVAVAADAWTAPAVGFLAGVAVRPDARGRGLGRTVFGFALAEALAGRRWAALMVDDANGAAIGLYRSFGFAYRPVSAASVES